MAFSLHFLVVLYALIFSVLNPAQADTSSGFFIHSRAAYYPDSDDKGTESEIYNKYINMHTYISLYLLLIHFVFDSLVTLQLEDADMVLLEQ